MYSLREDLTLADSAKVKSARRLRKSNGCWQARVCIVESKNVIVTLNMNKKVSVMQL